MTERRSSEVRTAPLAERLSVGLLFQAYPIKTVKAVLKKEGKASIRERALPNHVVIYYVLMLALFMSDSYREVMRRLLDGIEHGRRNMDSVRLLGKSGISQARTRLGHAPFKRLYEECVNPVATQATKGAWFKHWLLVSLDGSTLDVADTPENENAFGRANNNHGQSAFPKLRFVTLIESGSRVLFGAVSGPYSVTEKNLARQVVTALRKGMLCLADRYYLGYEFWQLACATDADLLWRVPS